MPETWTDARLDDLNGKVDGLGQRMEVGFNEVDARFDSMGARIDARFDAMDTRIDARFESMKAGIGARFNAMDGRIDARFDAMEGRIGTRFDSVQGGFNAIHASLDNLDASLSGMQRTMLQAGVALITALLGLIGLLITQL